jgi:hypothetical protein
MTDRDEFAAAALTGYLASESSDNAIPIGDAAADAYRYADAMLRQRDAEGRTTQQPALTGDERYAIRYCLMRTLDRFLGEHPHPNEPNDVCVNGVMLKRTLLDLIDRFPCNPKE